MKVGLVSLGCSKNQVDSEMILGLFKKFNIDITNDVEEADIIVVNTCGFIESAKKEAIDTILEMADYKVYGICKALIVTGCLAKRYKKQIIKTMPEVDLCIGVDEYDNIGQILSEFLNQNILNQHLDFNDRVISTNFPLAYIRISDGCDNRCSYCAIPLIRGNHKSRKIEDIVFEVTNLAKQGIKEFCLIAQDTSKYGLDIYGKLKLKELISKITKIEGVKWVRILYMYLFETTDELIEEIANNPKVCKYFDIPIQHISNNVLKRMNRKSNGESIKKLMNKIRQEIPDVILRTTVMVGFPGETKDDFDELYNFIKETKFDKLGAFMYSKEDGTPAAKLKNQIHPMTKKSRYNKIMELQKEISKQNLENKINKEYTALIEDVSFDNKYYIGRTYMDVPDMDGVIFIKNDTKGKDEIGKFVKCRIIDVKDYDLIAEHVNEYALS